MSDKLVIWRCVGCGVECPDLLRVCDCVTGIAWDRGKRYANIIDPSCDSNWPECMAPDGGEACSAFQRQARELEQARIDRALGDGENVLLRDENVKLHSDNAKLREGLRPFADEASKYGPANEDHFKLFRAEDFTIGDLRRAKSLLDQDGGK